MFPKRATKMTLETDTRGGYGYSGVSKELIDGRHFLEDSLSGNSDNFTWPLHFALTTMAGGGGQGEH